MCYDVFGRVGGHIALSGRRRDYNSISLMLCQCKSSYRMDMSVLTKYKRIFYRRSLQ